MSITTHVIDTGRGGPAKGVAVTLQIRASAGAYQDLGKGTTDDDGRLKGLMPEGTNTTPGLYRLLFDTGAYFAEQGKEAFFPEISIEFLVRTPGSKHHVPLLVASHGYTTYRGS